MNNFVLSLTTMLMLPFTSMFAVSLCDFSCWQPVFGVETGVVVTSNAGRSKTFPASSPSDEFYHYSCHHKTQTRFIYGGYVGMNWQDCSPWSVQLDVKYNQSTPFLVKGVLTQGIDIQSEDSYHYKYKLVVKQLLVEGRLAYVDCSWFRPYVLAGIGPSFNKAYAFSTTVPDTLTFTRDYKSDTKTGFTYAVGAGLDFEIIQCLYLGVSYRFTDFGKASLGSASIDDLSVSGSLSQNNFYASEFFAQLTFVF